MGSILPCCLPFGKAGGLQILCCQEINVTDYNFNLDALALKPSDFCNVRVDYIDLLVKFLKLRRNPLQVRPLRGCNSGPLVIEISATVRRIHHIGG